GTPDMIHQTQPDLVNDGLDFGRGCDRDVVLGLDEKKESNQKQCRRPQASVSLQTGVDGGENGGGADATESGHHQQSREGAVHFTANKLQEGHDCDVFPFKPTRTDATSALVSPP